MANTVKDTIKTRQIAIMAADGVDENSLNEMKEALEAAGAQTKIIASHLGFIAADGAGVNLMDLTKAGNKIRSENKAEKEHMAYGILLNSNSKEFINAIAQHRFWELEKEIKTK